MNSKKYASSYRPRTRKKARFLPARDNAPIARIVFRSRFSSSSPRRRVIHDFHRLVAWSLSCSLLAYFLTTNTREKKRTRKRRRGRGSLLRGCVRIARTSTTSCSALPAAGNFARAASTRTWTMSLRFAKAALAMALETAAVCSSARRATPPTVKCAGMEKSCMCFSVSILRKAV